MHSTVFGGHLVHYNSDFSGDVLINVPKKNVATSPFDDERVVVTVPFEALSALVAEKKRSELIRELERASDDEILKDW